MEGAAGNGRSFVFVLRAASMDEVGTVVSARRHVPFTLHWACGASAIGAERTIVEEAWIETPGRVPAAVLGAGALWRSAAPVPATHVEPRCVRWARPLGVGTCRELHVRQNNGLIGGMQVGLAFEAGEKCHIATFGWVSF